MNKKNKRLKLILMIVMIMIITFGTIYATIMVVKAVKFAGILIGIPISQERMEREFVKNQDDITKIAEYLENLDYSEILIRSSYEMGEMYALIGTMEIGEFMQISDNEMAQIIYKFMEANKYNFIEKEENGVYFQKWADLDRGRGVVYSLDGEDPQNELITILEPLAEKNWYFYEN